ncbi:MAG: hypothetical protein ACI30W_03110 [Muribaculaceae bacterium]
MRVSIFKSIFIAAVAIALTGCSGITPDTTDITGRLGKAYEVVNGRYDFDGKYLSVTMRRTDAEPAVDLDDVCSAGEALTSGKKWIGDFVIDFRDADGKSIRKRSAEGDLAEVLSLEEGDEAQLQFRLSAKKQEKVKSFRITTTLRPNDGRGGVNDVVGFIDAFGDITESMIGAAADAVDAIEALDDLD